MYARRQLKRLLGRGPRSAMRILNIEQHPTWRGGWVHDPIFECYADRVRPDQHSVPEELSISSVPILNKQMGGSIPPQIHSPSLLVTSGRYQAHDLTEHRDWSSLRDQIDEIRERSRRSSIGLD